MSEQETGTVKFWNDSKGYGFISRADKGDIFVHCSEILNANSLAEGDRVVFEIGEGRQGECAKKVKLVED